LNEVSFFFLEVLMAKKAMKSKAAKANVTKGTEVAPKGKAKSDKAASKAKS
jgi:hypothetical protein